MVVLLDNIHDSGILQLKHSWPVYFYIALFFIAVTPLEICFFALYRSVKKDKKGHFEHFELPLQQGKI
jgi:hypothetical protein